MIKSFSLDHTKIDAPLIRIADVYERNGVIIEKYDLRFVTPNTKYIDDKTMHSMEHLLATELKNEFKADMIDLSPMGCKTGFYFTTFKVEDCVIKITNAVLMSSKTSIPKPNKFNCGSYRLHNIKKARQTLQEISHRLIEVKND